MFGIPCPSCGGTTSFAHFVRGQWPSAIRANAAAFVGACTCALIVPWGLLSSAQGRLVRIHSPIKSLLWLLASISTIAIAQWAVRLFFA